MFLHLRECITKYFFYYITIKLNPCLLIWKTSPCIYCKLFRGCTSLSFRSLRLSSIRPKARAHGRICTSDVKVLLAHTDPVWPFKFKRYICPFSGARSWSSHFVLRSTPCSLGATERSEVPADLRQSFPARVPLRSGAWTIDQISLIVRFSLRPLMLQLHVELGRNNLKKRCFN